MANKECRILFVPHELSLVRQRERARESERVRYISTRPFLFHSPSIDGAVLVIDKEVDGWRDGTVENNDCEINHDRL